MTEKQVGIDNVLFIGLDWSKAQENGHAYVFHLSMFLPSTNHIQDNVNAKLRNLQVIEGLRWHIIKENFGDDKWIEKGLFDNSCLEEFDCKLLDAQHRWDSVESIEMCSKPAFNFQVFYI